ncbi:Hypothetical predicted protein, partial [Marmota monax]
PISEVLLDDDCPAAIFPSKPLIILIIIEVIVIILLIAFRRRIRVAIVLLKEGS